MFDIAQLKIGSKVQIDRARDEILTASAKDLLTKKYLRDEEDFQDCFARVALNYSDSSSHAQRVYDYISKLWFIPSPAILKSGGVERNLPIEYFFNECADNLYSAADIFSENLWIAARGGEVSSYWGNAEGKQKGVLPFIKAVEGVSIAVGEKKSVAYLPVSHPEIEIFLKLQASDLRRGVLISDSFMRAVEKNEEWALISPKNSSAVKKLPARKIWKTILEERKNGAEISIVFSDTVNKSLPEHQKLGGLRIKSSSGGGEILLPSGKDSHGQERSPACATASLNLEKFEEWESHPHFIEDVMRFLDNVSDDFIKRAEDTMLRSKYAVMRERSVGLGVIGFHSFLQEKGVAFEGMIAKVWNKSIFKFIKEEADKASIRIAHEKGSCPDAKDYGANERFSCKLAVVKSSDETVIAGGVSPDINPFQSNFENKHLKKILAEKGMDNEKTWKAIKRSGGSVQGLEFLMGDEKEIFKTACEVDQSWIIEHAADRVHYICHSQPVYIFADDIKFFEKLHLQAWKKEIKSLA